MFGKFSTYGRCCVENTSPKRIFQSLSSGIPGRKNVKKSNKNKNILINNKKYLYFRKYYDILTPTTIGAPWLFRLLIRLRVQDLAGKFELFLVSTYTAAVPAAAALYGLWRLLRNISEGEVFIPENVSILRLLSWCCIAAGLVCLFSALYYMPFLIVSAAAAFVGLILRVVKNVFAEAVRLKDENDYTI